ncbi:hypothetical protein M405DRAFT_870553 [Rhizopogon salebrosus TDB-379]|nr:hypothetical protein M405DRAFT_870553 [Rhizopogon salebrosus TDB-379]
MTHNGVKFPAKGAPHSPLPRVESTNGASLRRCAPYGGGRSVLAERATRAGESTNAPPTSLLFTDSPDFASPHIRLC